MPYDWTRAPLKERWPSTARHASFLYLSLLLSHAELGGGKVSTFPLLPKAQVSMYLLVEIVWLCSMLGHMQCQTVLEVGMKFATEANRL